MSASFRQGNIDGVSRGQQSDVCANFSSDMPLMFNDMVHQPSARHALVLCLALIAFGAAFYKVAHRPSPALFQLPAIVQKTGVSQTSNAAPDIRTHFVSTQQNISKIGRASCRERV